MDGVREIPYKDLSLKVVRYTRDPTTNDYGFIVPILWINTADDKIFILVNKTGTSGTWGRLQLTM